MDPDSDDLFREPIVYRSIALDFAAVEAPANGSNAASAFASAPAAGTAPAPFALGKTFAPHYASTAVAASSFALSEQPSFADFADPHGAGESAHRVLYAKPAYESPPLSLPQTSFAVASGATRSPSLDAKVIAAASTAVASHASIPTGQACPLPSNFERAWSLVVAPQQQQEHQPHTFISAGELCSALEAAIESSADDNAADDEQRPAECEADMSAVDRVAALRLRRARLRSVVVQRVDMDSFAIRGSADSSSASCDFFCQIFSETSLPSSASPASFVIEFQRRAGDGFAFRAAFERISARLVASLQCTVRPYQGNA